MHFIFNLEFDINEIQKTFKKNYNDVVTFLRHTCKPMEVYRSKFGQQKISQDVISQY